MIILFTQMNQITPKLIQGQLLKIMMLLVVLRNRIQTGVRRKKWG